MNKLGYVLLVLLVGAAIRFRNPAPSSSGGVPMPVRRETAPASIRPVRWSVVGAAAPHVVTPGRSLSLSLEAQIAKGWHIYSLSQKPGGPIPLSIRLIGTGDAIIRGVIKAPQPERQFDNNFGIETQLYSGSPQFTLQISVPSRARAGTRKIQLGARYQVCSETLCLPPRTDTLETSVRVRTRS